MFKEAFIAQNIKCAGCAESIQVGVSALQGVESVEVDVKTGEVVVVGSAVNREKVAACLLDLGYPELL